MSAAWHLLCHNNELSLRTLVCGQSFTWQTKDNSVYTNSLNGHLISIKAQNNQILFKSHNSTNIPQIESLLRHYFQLDLIHLDQMYAKWSQIDPNFAKKSIGLSGIRIMSQPPIENIFSFICSSNNNIVRIKSLVNKLSTHFGTSIGHFVISNSSTEYFSFPTAQQLAVDGIEEKLRILGFGYRAKYIAKSAKYIVEQGDGWAERVKEMPYQEARHELLKLSGVGPKVADCILLMSMNCHDAIPVDTHVWQIAVRDYNFLGKTKSKSLTEKLYQEIAHNFKALYGEYAGWAHSVLFTADLSKFKTPEKRSIEQESEQEINNKKSKTK